MESALLQTAPMITASRVPQLKERVNEEGVVPQKVKEKGRTERVGATVLREKAKARTKFVGTFRTQLASLETHVDPSMKPQPLQPKPRKRRRLKRRLRQKAQLLARKPRLRPRRKQQRQQ